MAADGRLTRAQARAIPALLAARTLREAAETAEIGERSLRRWLTEDDAFRTEYLAAARRTGYAATASLLTAQRRAVEVLVEALADDSSATRVRAAGLLLEYGRHARAEDFDTRLVELERRLEQWHADPWTGPRGLTA